MKTLQIRYSDNYKKDLKDLVYRFMQKFGADKMGFKAKLKAIGMSKGTFSSLLNGSYLPSKQSIVKMRAYLDDVTCELLKMDKSKNFFCRGCERILPIESRNKSDRWTCQPCSNIQKNSSRYNRVSATSDIYTLKTLFSGLTPKVLKKKAEYVAKKKYGKYAPAHQLIIQLKKELRKYEETTIAGKPSGYPVGHAPEGQRPQDETA